MLVRKYPLWNQMSTKLYERTNLFHLEKAWQSYLIEKCCISVHFVDSDGSILPLFASFILNYF